MFALVAAAEGKQEQARALLRTASGAAPAAGRRPTELDGRVLGYADLEPAEESRLSDRAPDEVIDLEPTGGMME